MKIVSLNGWGGKLHTELLAFLAEEKPDVLCLQEVVHSPETSREWLNYRDGTHVLPQRANFFRDICKALPHHEATFCPAAQGVLWDENQEPIASRWGLATFVHETLPVIGQAQDFVFKTYSPDGYGDHPRSRNAHAVRLYDHSGERAVTVCHMHGLRDLAGKGDTPARLGQAHRLLALTQRVAQPDDLVVICGDFNVEPGSETLQLLAEHGFLELVTAGGFRGTRTSHYSKPGRFADYMLVNRPEAVKDFNVLCEPEVSDHCPLRLEI
jgi:endonuclease/exonuclease/phosphatase family metal-dependent hydrolase